MKARYIKLKSGEWGVEITGAAAAPETVLVTKRDGSQKTERPQAVVWQGRNAQGEPVMIVALAGRGVGGRQGGWRSTRRGDSAPGGRRCDYCGSRSCARAWDPRGLCDED